VPADPDARRRVEVGDAEQPRGLVAEHHGRVAGGGGGEEDALGEVAQLPLAAAP
jgi:hypothetical protein